MNRISFAFRSFFAILFGGSLPEDIALAFGFAKPAAAKPAPPPATPADGALQILSVLQRDSRLVDFLMEDIGGYSDDQVGAAARTMHEQCRAALERYVKLAPVIDGVEGTFTKVDKLDAARVKLLGNVPASGKAPGGTLRHKGWRAESVGLPPLGSPEARVILAPAEIEIE
ncbi:MAG: DUF2760 domain-containing protein [Bryobacteraceae bacterium]